MIQEKIYCRSEDTTANEREGLFLRTQVIRADHVGSFLFQGHNFDLLTGIFQRSIQSVILTYGESNPDFTLCFSGYSPCMKKKCV